MLDNTLYNRQSTLDLKLPDTIAVIGCGGGGSWVALFSALIGIKTIHLFDSDTIEESNRNRLPFSKESIGDLKTVETARLIESMRDTKVIIHKEIDINNISPELLLCDVVFDCTDNYNVQKALFKYCTKNELTYLKGGYNGNHITVTSVIPEWGEDENVSGYEQPPTPSYVIPAALSASLLVLCAINDIKPTIGGDITKIGFKND